jgi:Ca2+-transporting ATPase
MATGALRTIAFALRDGLTELKTYSGPSHPDHALLADPSNFAKIESGMTFLGLVGILDPPRPECKPAIAACAQAGISVIMITGDNKDTAEAISRNLGILSHGGSHKDCSFTGKEFEDLPEKEKETLSVELWPRREQRAPCSRAPSPATSRRL